MIKKCLKKIIFSSFAKKAFQAFYHKTFWLSRMGLGYGVGGDFADDGEYLVMSYIKTKLQAKAVSKIIIFDIGANVGSYSQKIAEVFADQEADIFAFEPSLTTYNQLLANSAAYKNIHPVNLALSDLAGSATLFSDQALSGLASLSNRRLDHFNIKNNFRETVECVTLDDYCQRSSIANINFLKLDIEGLEYQAFLGAQSLLSKGLIDFIQFEFGGANIDSRTFFQDFFYLLSGKYRLYRILKDGLLEIDKYSEDLEQFTTVNYLAELKS